MIYGLDLLGLNKYLPQTKAVFPAGWALGAFAETFGDAYKAIDAMLQTGKVAHLRVQLIWSDTHSFGDKDIPKVRKLSRQYEQLKRKYPNIPFELSPFCEHNLTNPDKYLDIVKAEAPSCIPVNTVWKGKLSDKYKNEVHGPHAKPQGEYNYSYDGTACVDSNVTAAKSAHSSADVFFFWDARFNGKWEDNDKTPRPQRKGWPDKELIRSIVYLATDKGNTNLPKKWIYKSHSENKGNGDKRAEKPVFIIPVKAKEILLKNPSGKVIDTLSYYGPYNDGRHRYYSKEWGYKTAQICDLCDVVVNGKVYGQIDPGFRDGEYR